MIDQEKTDKNLEIRVWDTCSPLGKAFIINGCFFGADALLNILTGKRILDYIGFKFPEESFIELSNTMMFISSMYGIYKAWFEKRFLGELYYERYGHLAQPEKTEKE